MNRHMSANQGRTLEEMRTEAVWEAAKAGELEEMRRLIENTAANMQARDREHNSALHYGTLSGREEIVRYLVERVGLNPLSANKKGETPWDIAYREGKREVLAYLEQWFGCPYEETYHNPVRRGFYPDPSIVRVGEDYYMVNSTFVFFPSIPVSHSKDLVHWEIIGYAITNPEWARLEELNGGMGYWAPDISFCQGKFYITATLRMNDDMEKRRIQMVTSSDRPEGPYEEPAFLDDDGIDPSIFHDDDGRKYMLLNRGARIRELSADCRRFISPAVMLWYGDCKRKPEGPHLLKRRGWYYLFLAEGGTGMGHQITVARSRTLMGPYEPSPHNPVLSQRDAGALIQCCGHGKPVQLPDGRWYIVYLCLRMTEGKNPGAQDRSALRYGILGRETSLDPLTWTEEGWPLINGGRGPSDQQRLPFGRQLGEQKLQRRQREGGYPLWKEREWMTPRPLPDHRIRIEHAPSGDFLKLKGQEGDLNRKDFRSIFVTRQEAFEFQCSCVFQVPELREGQSLGIVCYYDENSYIKYGICRQGGAFGILLQEYAGEGYISEKFTPCPEQETGAGRRVRLCMRAEGLTRTFWRTAPTDSGTYQRTASTDLGTYQRTASADSGTYQRAAPADSQEEGAPVLEVENRERLEDTAYLSSEGLKKGKRFTGATMGIYVQGEVWGTFLDWQ